MGMLHCVAGKRVSFSGYGTLGGKARGYGACSQCHVASSATIAFFRLAHAFFGLKTALMLGACVIYVHSIYVVVEMHSSCVK
jgi:hypothetical protein